MVYFSIVKYITINQHNIFSWSSFIDLLLHYNLRDLSCTAPPTEFELIHPAPRCCDSKYIQYARFKRMDHFTLCTR